MSFVICVVSFLIFFIGCQKDNSFLNNANIEIASVKQVNENGALIAPTCPSFQQVTNVSNAIIQLYNKSNCNLPLVNSNCNLITRTYWTPLWRGCYNQTFSVTNLDGILAAARREAIANQPTGYSIVRYQFDPDMFGNTNCDFVIHQRVTYARCGVVVGPNPL